MTDHRIPDITPLDPDLVALTSYLAGELTPDEAAVVEQRLRDDDVFWMKAGPIVKLWNLPVRYETLLQAHAAAPELSPAAAVAPTAPASEWARATAAAIVRGVGAETLAAPSTGKQLTSTPITKVAPTAHLPFGERAFRYWFDWVGEGMPEGPGNYRARVSYVLGTLAGFAVGHDRRVNPPDNPVDKSPALSAIWEWTEKGVLVTALASVVLVFGLGLYGSYQNADDSALIRRAVHAITREPLPGAAKVETQAAQEVALALPSGTRVTVRASSRLQWNAAGAVLLRGAATFDVPLEVAEQRVLTDYGDIRMGPGQYAVGRDGTGKLALVSVLVGAARIRADTSDTTAAAVTHLGPGEFGSLSSRGQASKVSPHDAGEHPSYSREQAVLRTTPPVSAENGGVQRWRQFSWIRVAAGSRMTWDTGNAAVLHLAGEMALVLDPRDGITLVKTDFGDVVLRPGSYAIKTVTDFEKAPAILVTTKSGRAWMIPETEDFTASGAAVEAGQFGMSRNKIPRLTEGGADYPATIPDSLAAPTPFGTDRRVRP